MNKKLLTQIISGSVFGLATLISIILNIGISQFRIANIICAGIMVVSLAVFAIAMKIMK